jgi:radical SAM/Cys-rich protein
MDADTAREVVAFARRGRFQVVDITGGAPELNPNLPYMISSLARFAPEIILRSNLTALGAPEHDSIIELCREHCVTIVGSLPSVNGAQTDALRGAGVWEKSIPALKKLNALGYGHPGSGLELHLASNPSGAFLPPSQKQAERKFRQDLQRKWGISFNELFTFANVPLGRFGRWLKESGNFENYMEKLAASFNPSTVPGLMCRTLLSVSWDGYLFDCDFNLAKGMAMGERKIHISQLEQPPVAGTPIAISDHCYACTAGAGFTCGGAIAAEAEA